jgi:hypothetical protein
LAPINEGQLIIAQQNHHSKEATSSSNSKQILSLFLTTATESIATTKNHRNEHQITTIFHKFEPIHHKFIRASSQETKIQDLTTKTIGIEVFVSKSSQRFATNLHHRTKKALQFQRRIVQRTKQRDHREFEEEKKKMKN